MITLAKPIPSGMDDNWQATVTQISIAAIDFPAGQITTRHDAFSTPQAAAAGKGAVTTVEKIVKIADVPGLAQAIAELETVCTQDQDSPLFGGTVSS